MPQTQSETPLGDPPPYSQYPQEERKADVALFERIKSLHTISVQENEVTVFTTTIEMPGKPWGAWGTLELGYKRIMDVLYPNVWYRPFRGPKEKTVESDISSSIEVKADSTPGVLHYVKIRDHSSYIDYAFDIKVEKLGTQDASFEGTFSGVDSKGTEWVGQWSGQFSNMKTRKDSCTGSKVEAPAKLDAGTGDLDRITPISDQSDGFLITGPGMDIPQTYADHAMSQIMLHALDAGTKAKFFPNLTTLKPEQQKVLDANKTFFETAIIYRLTAAIYGDTALKMSPSNDETKKKKMLDKLKAFWDVARFQPESDESNAAVDVLGWKRGDEKIKEKVKTLHTQFQNANMALYEQAYIEKFPAWKKFLKEPVYWFKQYSAYLTAKEQVMWLQAKIHRASEDMTTKPGDKAKLDKIQETSASFVLRCLSKLILLKNAAGEAGKDLRPHDAGTYLSNMISSMLHSTQLVNEKLSANFAALVKALEQKKDTEEYKHLLFLQAQCNAKSMEELVELSSRVFSTKGTAMDHARRWLARKAPQAVNPADVEINMQEFIRAQEDGAFRGANLGLNDEVEQLDKTLSDIDPADLNFEPPAVPGQPPKIPPKGKALVKAFWSGVQFILHLGAFAGAIYAFTKLEFGQMSWSQAAATITALGTVAFNFGLRCISFVLTKWVTRWSFPKFTQWVKSVDLVITAQKTAGRLAQTMLGNLNRMLRGVAVLGCVFAIFTTYADMTSDNSTESFKTFSKWQFGLAVAECVLIIGSIVVEFFALESVLGGALLLCGPLGAVVGLVALGIGIWYYFKGGKPDPDADIKDFLKGKPKDEGLYEEH